LRYRKWASKLTGMARPPKNPEGSRTNVTIRLPGKHLEILDATAIQTGTSRSDVVIRLIERLKGWTT
jgi:hypothetical protein